MKRKLSTVHCLSFVLAFAILAGCEATDVSTLAGSEKGFVDGIESAARFNQPTGIAIDTVGTLYVTDMRNQRIRKVTPNGEVSTLADNTGSAARFNMPFGIAIDATDNLYVTDHWDHKILKVTPKGEVNTLAGRWQGNADGTGIAARFNNPSGIAIDATGNLYVADTNNHRICKVTPNGEVSTLAGSGEMGDADGTGGGAQFFYPQDITIDVVGNLYVTDRNRIRKVTPEGEVSTLVGSTSGFADGVGNDAQFNSPAGITVDKVGNLYVADTFNNIIRKVTPKGEVSTLAGSAARSESDDVAFYALDTDGKGFFKVTPKGDVEKTTISKMIGANFKKGGFADGAGSKAQFDRPFGIAIDAEGNLFVTDENNNRIRKLSFKK